VVCSWGEKKGSSERQFSDLATSCGLFQDGLIHMSLKPAEILYLTVAYDWFLFG
jgi:hypothetical protein